MLWLRMANANVPLLSPPGFFVSRMGNKPVSLEITGPADGFRVVRPRSWLTGNTGMGVFD